MAVHIFPPWKIRILLFRPVCQEKITDGIRLIIFQQILYPDGIIPAGGYFSSLQRHILARYNPVRQMPVFTACQKKSRQDNRVKGNIILPVHIIMHRVLSPETVKIIASRLCCRFACGQIAQHIFRPDINRFIFIAFLRNLYPPFQIPCQGAIPQSLVNIPVCKCNGVFPPLWMRVNQRFQFLLKPGNGKI